MDKQKEIENIAYEICNYVKSKDMNKVYVVAESPMLEYLHNTGIAEWLVEKGYGDVRYVVKEVLNKVFRYIEEARLECEFQDKDGKWFMDESEFMCEFTLGKLHELYHEYGIEIFGDSEEE